jgi:hypothetical protein
MGSTLLETTLFAFSSHELYCACQWYTASFGSEMKRSTASAAPFWHLPVPGGTSRWRMQAVWWLVWPKLFGSGARAVVEGWTPSGHKRLLSASRVTVAPAIANHFAEYAYNGQAAPGHYMHTQQSGQQSATLLPFKLCRCGRQAVLTVDICFGLCASEEWRFAYILRSGCKLVSACNPTLPLVAACSGACVLRAFPAGMAVGNHVGRGVGRSVGAVVLAPARVVGRRVGCRPIVGLVVGLEGRRRRPSW